VHKVRQGENVMDSANKGTLELLGDADFDLAFYANNPNIQ
jgi:hypothetical protein